MADRPCLHCTLTESPDGMAAPPLGRVRPPAAVMRPYSRGKLDASLPKSYARVGSSDEFRRRIDLDSPGLLASIMPAIRGIIRICLHSRGIQPGPVGVDDLAQGIAVLLLERDCRLMKAYDPRRSSPVTWLTLIVRTNVWHLLRHYTDGAKHQAESPLSAEQYLNGSNSWITFLQNEKHQRSYVGATKQCRVIFVGNNTCYGSYQGPYR